MGQAEIQDSLKAIDRGAVILRWFGASLLTVKDLVNNRIAAVIDVQSKLILGNPAGNNPTIATCQILGEDGLGINIVGSDVLISGGRSTGNSNSPTIAFQSMVPIGSGSTRQTRFTALSINQGGDLRVNKTVTPAGTTGNQTINKAMGTVNFAAGTSSLIVTNNLCQTTSIILVTIRTNDVTLKSVIAVPAIGSFTLIANANATAETSVGFLVTN